MKDLAQLLELSPAERLALVEALWASLVEVPEAVPVSEAVREELDRRLSAYYADPTSARPWDEVRAELQHEALWIEEAEARCADFRAGRTAAIDGDEVFARARDGTGKSTKL